MSAYAVLDCRLEIYNVSGVLRLDVLSFNANYSINEIPTATVSIAAGKTACGGQFSSVYRLEQARARRYPAVLYVTIEPTDDAKNPAFAGSFTVFSGYISGMSPSFKFGRNTIELQLIHWLSDLDCASTLASAANIGSPWNLAAPIRTGLRSLPGYAYLPVATFLDIMTPGAIATDVWGNAIFPLLMCLLQEAIMGYDSWGLANDGSGGLAQASLSRCAQMLALPLNMSTLGSAMQIVAEGIGISLAKTFQPNRLQSLARGRTTIWQLLRELAYNYYFTIIPFPSYYTIRPWTPCLMNYLDWESRGITISGSEILQFAYTSKTRQVPLRSVLVYAGGEPPTLPADIHTFPGNIFGMYTSMPDLGYGERVYLKAHDFLQYPFFAAKTARESFQAALRGGSRQLAKAVKLRNTILSLEQALAYVAQYHFIQYNSLPRTGTVTTPFRGDISPGSNISLGVLADDFLGTEPALVNKLYATVKGVTYSVSPGQIPTSTYSLVGIRNYYEHFANYNYSLSQHPIYARYYIGAKHLV